MLKQRRALAFVGCMLVWLSILRTSNASATGGAETIGDGSTVGTVVSTDGTPGAQTQPNPTTGTEQQGTGQPDPCWYTPIEAAAGDPRLGGDPPSAGTLYAVSCPDAINSDTGAPVFATLSEIWVRDGQPVVPPPPDPSVIAEQAAAELTVPNPRITLGPDEGKIAVKVPVWLSVDTPGPLSYTVAVRGLSVTVVASLKSTTWSMGEPVDPANPGIEVAAIKCEGPGVSAPPGVSSSVIPPCGYTYHWKSLATRTAGSGKWSVTATTDWAVTWTASSGASGTLNRPLRPSSTKQVVVHEWRSSLVANPGG
ncbi:hypothetical protein SAMN04515671_2838 [Nakamurella panacisegetis]|uniref:Uncharacterized protein n=1 Tax=Nakamurella panacisegetis TaxID=1090615 RepID=A0A1H0PNE7_9ACTN|nr:hypothetical protein SAMN04515671_2838 [Nakamurella panacisegetis]